MPLLQVLSCCGVVSPCRTTPSPSATVPSSPPQCLCRCKPCVTLRCSSWSPRRCLDPSRLSPSTQVGRGGGLSMPSLECPSQLRTPPLQLHTSCQLSTQPPAASQTARDSATYAASGLASKLSPHQLPAGWCHLCWQRCWWPQSFMQDALARWRNSWQVQHTLTPQAHTLTFLSCLPHHPHFHLLPVQTTSCALCWTCVRACRTTSQQQWYQTTSHSCRKCWHTQSTAQHMQACAHAPLARHRTTGLGLPVTPVRLALAPLRPLGLCGAATGRSSMTMAPAHLCTS